MEDSMENRPKRKRIARQQSEDPQAEVQKNYSSISDTSESEGAWRAYVANRDPDPQKLKPTYDLTHVKYEEELPFPHEGKKVAIAHWRSTNAEMDCKLTVHCPTRHQKPDVMGFKVRPNNPHRPEELQDFIEEVTRNNIQGQIQSDGLGISFNKDATRRVLKSGLLPPVLQASIENWLENEGIPLPSKSGGVGK